MTFHSVGLVWVLSLVRVLVGVTSRHAQPALTWLPDGWTPKHPSCCGVWYGIWLVGVASRHAQPAHVAAGRLDADTPVRVCDSMGFGWCHFQTYPACHTAAAKRLDADCPVTVVVNFGQGSGRWHSEARTQPATWLLPDGPALNIAMWGWDQGNMEMWGRGQGNMELWG